MEIIEYPSSFYDERPAGIVIDTLILHSMYNPEAPFPFALEACKQLLDRHEVSAHYLIDREGIVARCVAETDKAWHAGVSRHPVDDRENVNDFSIGVELIADNLSGYSIPQFQSLLGLTLDILTRRPITSIFGHCHIAPDRKTDPWHFDWRLYMSHIYGKTIRSPRLYSPIY